MLLPFVGDNIGFNPLGPDIMEHGHGLSIEDMRAMLGGTVMVVGAGIGRWEDYMLSQFGDTDTTIINIDPIYDHPDWRKEAERLEAMGPRTGVNVFATAQRIPLPDGFVDTAISSWSIPLLVSEKDLFRSEKAHHLQEIFTEITRVMKQGGVLRLDPLSSHNLPPGLQKSFMDLCVGILEDNGVSSTTTEYVGRVDGEPAWMQRLKGVKK